jgi:hypothetical protein
MERKEIAAVEPKRAVFGFAVSLSAGILSLFWGIGAIDRAINPSYGWGSILDRRPTAPVWFSGVDLGTLGAIEVLCAVIVIIGAIVIFTLRRETIGSVLVIAFSVIGFIALGSSVIFNIFGIIGGALGLAKR